MPSRLIVLEGIDGAGKTTLAQHLARSWERAQFVSNKTAALEPSFAAQAMTRVSELLWPGAATDFDHLMPTEYWLYLKATWYALFDRFVVRPACADDAIIVVDGYYYRFVAKMMLRGYKENEILRMFSHVRTPDVVILLRVSPAAAFERRAEFRPHELGLHQGPLELGRSSFVAYQKAVAGALDMLAQRFSWCALDVEPVESPTETLGRIHALVSPNVAMDSPHRCVDRPERLVAAAADEQAGSLLK